jgi:hypothetical protein
MGRGLLTAQIMLIIYYQIKLDKLNIYETLTYSIPKMCCWLCMRFCIISSHCLSLSSAALSVVREEQVDEEVEVLIRRRYKYHSSQPYHPKQACNKLSVTN